MTNASYQRATSDHAAPGQRSPCQAARSPVGTAVRRALSGSMAGLCGLLLASATTAQVAPSSDRIEEVVVSATRVGTEDVQHVSMAISVVNTEELTRQGFASLAEFENNVPSLAVQENGPGQNKIAIRGISDPGNIDATNLEDQSLVSVYLDDTPISLQGATPDLRVFDLERVEVIRGPQGTLYGAGSMAGTIRFITRKPDPNSSFGYAEGVVSDTSGGGTNYNLRGMVNLPLAANKLGATLSAYRGTDSGYIDNVGYGKKDANSVDTSQARAALRLLANDQLTIDLSVIYSKLNAYGSNATYSGLGNGHDQYSTLTPEFYEDRLTLSNLTLAWDLGFANLTSSSSYNDRAFGTGSSFEVIAQALIFGVPTASPDTIENKVSEFTQEIRLNSKGAGPFKWITGVFYDRSNRRYLQNDLTPGLDAVIGVSSIDFNAPVNDDLFYGDEHLKQRQLAVFGEATYTIADRLDLTAGARYFDYTQTYGLYFGGVAGSLAPGEPLVQTGSTKESGVNPRVAATYHVSNDLMFYTEAAKGFRYGGVNQPVPASFCGDALSGQGLSGAPLTFGPDKLWSYSVGEKSTLANGRATLNLAAFYVDWKGLQTNDLLSCGYYFTENAGRVTSKGLEVEAAGRVTERLTLTANGSYTDATAAEPIPNLSALKGDPVPYFPKYIASASAQYKVPLADTQSVSFQINGQYRSSSFSNFSPLSRVELPASTVLNAAFTYSRDKWEVGLFAHNLTNEHVMTSAAIDTFGPLQPGDVRYYARPRTIGLRARVGF